MLRFIILLLTTISFASFAAPKSELWPYWSASNEANSQTISHQAWQNTLDKYLHERGQHRLFDYRAVTQQDRKQLKGYLNQLSQLDPRDYPRAEQYAYWVNLYNALTVDLIIDNYPVKSITKLGGLFTFGPWGQEIITINGKPLTLNDIEHRILRPIWQDPRIHYAVNCASLGCPNLQPQAFTAQNTPALLDAAATEFINSEKGASLSNGKLTLSEIYDWFSDDFGTQQKLFQHLGKYRPDLAGYRGKVSYEYDWTLNDR
ncbi:DUF547 domain-containing protein [Vibrio sp. WXL103]|uniref:DUF547 domain-containing protein n=1 Tax=unclassified Vibrio TaxID=2614977 RepID=UPI003EC88142